MESGEVRRIRGGRGVFTRPAHAIVLTATLAVLLLLYRFCAAREMYRDLGSYSPRARQAIIERFERASMPFRLEGASLFVEREFESRARRIIGGLSAPDKAHRLPLLRIEP